MPVTIPRGALSPAHLMCVSLELGLNKIRGKALPPQSSFWRALQQWCSWLTCHVMAPSTRAVCWAAGRGGWQLTASLAVRGVLTGHSQLPGIAVTAVPILGTRVGWGYFSVACKYISFLRPIIKVSVAVEPLAQNMVEEFRQIPLSGVQLWHWSTCLGVKTVFPRLCTRKKGKETHQRSWWVCFLLWARSLVRVLRAGSCQDPLEGFHLPVCNLISSEVKVCAGHWGG